MVNKGWTLIFNVIDEGFLPLQRMASSLANSLSADVNINVYYTPAGTQGFGFHTDAHEVFIKQLSGRKAWKVYRLGDHENTAKPAVDQILETGQILYIPENCRHSGTACEEEDSLHLTIGFSSRRSQVNRYLRRQLDTWLNSNAGIECLKTMDFPSQSPTGRNKLTPPEVKRILTDFGEHLKSTPAVHAVPAAAIERLPPAQNEQLMPFDSIEAFTVSANFSPHPESNDAVVCQLPVGPLRFRNQFLEALEYVSRSKRVQVTNLPLNHDDGIALCRVLYGAGALKGTL